MDRLEHMARSKADGTHPVTTIGWAAALALVLFGGITVASGLLAPGVALAATLPSGATGAHVWIVDGGPEVAANMPWRIEIMVEYIAAGLAAIFVALRFGRGLLVKLQDWYEGVPLVPAKPLPQPVPAVIMPRPGHGRARPAANGRKRELHAA